MADTSVLSRSFAGGEITPELYGRLDLTKFQTGLAIARNFRVLPHGPAVTREGSEFINEVKTSAKQTRIVPFAVSDTVTYILELGDSYIRFHTNGGTVVEAAQTITALTSGTPSVVTINAHGYTNGQWVFITGVLGLAGPVVNNRFLVVAGATANTFTLTDAGGNAISTGTAWIGGGTAARVYEIAVPYVEADLFNLHYAQATTKLSIAHQSYAPRELVITAPTSWALSTISFASPLANPATVTPAATVNVGVGATSMKYYYLITALDDSGNESTGSGSAFIQNNLYTAGNRNRVSWSAVAGATYYKVYRAQSDSLGAGAASQWGYIGTAQATEFVDDNIAPDHTIAPPVDQTIFASATNYPAAVGYFEQRRVFAGTATEPQTTWLSKSGTDSVMSKPTPLQDDSPMKFRIAARQLANINHIVPLDDLLLFTGSVVWRVFNNNNDALTPTNIALRPLAYNGSSLMVQPVTVFGSVLFAENTSQHIIELRYTVESGGYRAADATLMAPHLLNGYTVRDISFAPGRYKTLWTVRSDGVLLGMTYVPEQDVNGWHRHDTDGTYESVATVLEGTEDATYVIVKRTINGRQVRYIERMKTRSTTTLTNAYQADAFKVYSGTPTSTITGLYHLEGKTVSVLADGAVQSQKVVTGGQISLDAAASTVLVGLPFTAQLQLLPLSLMVLAAGGVGMQKNVDNVNLRVKDSSGFKVGPSFTQLREYKQRTTEPYGSPPALYSGIAKIKIDGHWTQDSPVCIQVTDPLPCMVTAASLEVTLGD